MTTARDADPAHRSGLPAARLRESYRLMALARALDERAWILNRSGRVHFVISAQGPEGAEAAICAALTPGRDWLLPYYRSMAAAPAFGMTPRELMLQQLGRAADSGSGGRQMPAHYGGVAYRSRAMPARIGHTNKDVRADGTAVRFPRLVGADRRWPGRDEPAADASRTKGDRTGRGPAEEGLCGEGQDAAARRERRRGHDRALAQEARRPR